MNERFGREYFENGVMSGVSLYQNYRWIPELTIPMAHFLVNYCGIKYTDFILDFGCAKGYLVKALRLLNYKAYGVDVSHYAISQAPADVSLFVRRIGPHPDEELMKCDWVIAKDVLEHINLTEIDGHLKRLSSITKNIFILVPLARDQTYIITSNELDVTHKIRESLEWWQHRLEMVGFQVEAEHYSGPWKQTIGVNTDGNGILIGRKP